eukprot:TRINITY_DN2388_c0_g1_i1.p2 TRINITY_DN2388_c0_g1~~TRINITY_DN2388_c0_g1_i1.p2  ORF type:complete len:243 (-),score=18.38 TRINITY_DN2388_c0_g1_i1:428-1051(-)
MYHDVCMNDEQAEKALRIRRRIKPSIWTRYFFERRKVQALYCLTRRQLRIFVGLALCRHGRAAENLVAMLERRLDVVLWRSLLSPSIYAARYAIMCKQVKLNGQVALRPGYLCWPGDVIQVGYDRAPQMLNYLSRKDNVDKSIGLNRSIEQDGPGSIVNNALLTKFSQAQQATQEEIKKKPTQEETKKKPKKQKAKQSEQLESQKQE